MQYILDLLRDYAPFVIFAVAFLETLGVPFPAFPLFVLSGCLIIEGSLSWQPIVITAMTGALTADLAWYYLGKHMGKKAIGFLCRWSVNPDSCIGRSQTLFIHNSIPVILVAKLIPGVNTLVPSLSGIMGISPLRYIILDAAGCLIWVSAGISLGLAFGRGVLSRLTEVQYTLLFLVIAMLVFYVIFRIGYRYYLVKRYTIPLIEADVLQRDLASDPTIILLDLRTSTDYADSTQVLPGAQRIPPAELERSVDSLPQKRKIVLYCNCRNKSAGAGIARTFINKGYTDIHTLQGGYEEWIKRGYATSPKPSP
jgi:membrane protein DedA with SNARE-associated domain/rhodanese-related sulfurtransferase